MNSKYKYSARVFLLIFSLILINKVSFAQEGSPFITNYDLKNQYKFHNWSVIQDEDQNMLFANQKGILSFDGHIWDMIHTPALPHTMYFDTITKKVFVGCENEIGYLKKDSAGTILYHSIKEVKENIGEIKEIISTENRLIALSENYICVFNNEDFSKISQIPNQNIKSPLKNIINYSDEIYFATKDNRFYKFENDSIKEVIIKNKQNIGEILFDVKLSDKRTLIGTSKNKFYFFGGKSVWQFNIQDQKYLSESILLDALLLSENKIAVSTLIGGIIIIDINTRKTIKTVNYSSGLPDNEIHSIGKDRNNGFWLSHQLGISRIDFNIPVKFYNSYPGYEGRLLSVINHNNTVYVGTSESLFFLEEIDDYRRARLMESQISNISRDIKKKKALEVKDSKKKKGLFKGFQRKIKKMMEVEDEISLSERRRDALIRNRKKLGMQSLSHTYRKIEGIDDRCKFMIPFNDILLVGGNNGVYQIIDNEAERIIADKYVNKIIKDKNNSNLLYVCTNTGLMLLEYIEDEWEMTDIDLFKGESIFSVITNDTSIWIGTDNDAYLLDTARYSIKTLRLNNVYNEPVILQEYENNIFALLPSKTLYYDNEKDSLIEFISKDLTYMKNQDNILWMYDGKKWTSLVQPEDYNRQNNIYLRLFSNLEYIYIDKKNSTWLIDDQNNLYRIDHSAEDFSIPEQKILITGLSNAKGEVYYIKELELEPNQNSLNINLSAPFFIKQNSVEYRYFLEGLMDSWSDWTKESNFNFPYIPHGKYTLHVKARNILGNISETQNLAFTIKEPFWEKDWFLISAGVTSLLLIILIIRMRERNLQKNKRLLEKKIKDRTKTIEKQRDQIEKTHRNIQDSIVYAKRIQQAIMPSKEVMDQSFNDYFIFFKPRDIVSGDFYWIKQIRDFTVYAVADCTGHGVPGAMLSMLGITFLSEIVTKARFDTPDEILNRLRKKVKTSLKQTNKTIESKDGMDIALCVIDHESLELQFAGAYNPIYIIRSGQLIEIKATRNPIGIHLKETPFKYNSFQLKEGDILYTFSDGYPDQFGQNINQKFNKSNFKKLLVKIHQKPMSEQKEILNDILKKWRGETDQTDDILIIGVRV